MSVQGKEAYTGTEITASGTTSKPDTVERNTEQKDDDLGKGKDIARTDIKMKETPQQNPTAHRESTPPEQCNQNITELLAEVQKLHSLICGEKDSEKDDGISLLKESQSAFLEMLDKIEATVGEPPKDTEGTERKQRENENSAPKRDKAIAGTPRMKTLLQCLEQEHEQVARLKEEAQKIQTELDTYKQVQSERTSWYKSLQEDFNKQQQTIVNIPEVLSEEEKRGFQMLMNILEREAAKAKMLDETRDKLTQKEEKLKRIEKEADILRQRLSKAAGAKLTDGNPNITDLNDPNRPMKLGERYTELNDNQWTDAYEILTGDKVKPKAAITLLREIVTACYEECVRLSEEQWKRLARILTQTKTENADETLKEIGFQQTEYKDLKNLRKMAATKSSEYIMTKVKETLLEKLKDVKKPMMKQLKAFTEESIRLSWDMAVQDPPVYMFWGLKRGDPPSDQFRTYTESGNKVRYVVWPSLHLHKGGPLLTKGVYQLYT